MNDTILRDDALCVANYIRKHGPKSRIEIVKALSWKKKRVYDAFRFGIEEKMLDVLCHTHLGRYGSRVLIFDVVPGRQALIHGRLCDCVPYLKRKPRVYSDAALQRRRTTYDPNCPSQTVGD